MHGELYAAPRIRLAGHKSEGYLKTNKFDNDIKFPKPLPPLW